MGNGPSCLRGMVVVSLGGLVLLACAGEPADRMLRPATIDTSSSGVIQVVNHGPNEWADSGGWRLELERVIVSADSGPAMFSTQRNVAAASSGEVVLIDSKPTVIKVFSSDGAFIRRIGREGSGPGEYKASVDLAIIGDTVVVSDRQNVRIVLFGIDGTYLRSVPGTRGRMWRATTSDGRIQLDTRLAAREGTPEDYYAGSGVRRIRTDGSVADSFFYPPQAEPRGWSDARGSVFIPLAPDREKTLNANGELIWGDQGVYRLMVTADGRDTVRVIEAPAPAVSISDSVRRAELAKVFTYAPWVAEIATVNDIPEVYPVWSEVYADMIGNLWVLRRNPSGPGSVLDVFAPDGRLRGSIAAPFETLLFSYWTADRIYRIGQNENDVPQVEVWRVVR